MLWLPGICEMLSRELFPMRASKEISGCMDMAASCADTYWQPNQTRRGIVISSIWSSGCVSRIPNPKRGIGLRLFMGASPPHESPGITRRGDG